MSIFLRRLKNFWQLLTKLLQGQEEIIGEGRPFFIFLTIILGIVSILVAYNTPNFQEPLLLIGFVIIMLVHISLHWLSSFTITSFRWSVIYLTTQGILGFTVVLISGAPELALAIFAAMIGETIGTFGTRRFVWLAVMVFVILTPISYFLIGGMETLNDWYSVTASTLIMLIVFMVLFRRQLDTSQRAQALAVELETANHQLAEYAAQVEDFTLNTERQRMARELHDTLAQGVAGLVLQLEAVKAHLASGRAERGAQIIDQALVRARSTLAESRAVIDDLRSIPVDLSEVLQAKIERFTQATGIPCEVDFVISHPIPIGVGEHALRVLSEALANVTRHAQATNVSVKFINIDHQLELDICDNGIGFDVELATRLGHYGLLGMRERARLAGGILMLQSHMGQGTRVNFLIPIPGEK